MKGTIIAINPRTQFHAVRTEDGDITVFELIDSHELAIGRVVSGELHTLGSETLTDMGDGMTFDAFIQDAYCSEARARELLKR